MTGGRSAAVPGERIAQHLSERAPNAEDNYDTLSPNQKTSGRTGLCPEETTKISILSGRNRFIPDEILIEGQKIKTTGALMTGGRSAAVPGERIAQHLSERALTADGIYDTLSPNHKTSGKPDCRRSNGPAYTQKSPASSHWSDSSKNGGYLLSHLVGQYHRR